MRAISFLGSAIVGACFAARVSGGGSWCTSLAAGVGGQRRSAWVVSTESSRARGQGLIRRAAAGGPSTSTTRTSIHDMEGLYCAKGLHELRSQLLGAIDTCSALRRVTEVGAGFCTKPDPAHLRSCGRWLDTPLSSG